ncbi:MAG: NAD-dependent epimerase/dehydratase family protein, partial [Candidatus Gastranaerophilales bacterium]|nr:NAD-dependent epimerase/dehydratase family protein [Candidatus Gastranaerophilales bacterium]
MDKRILITGAGGFVGKNLTEFLSDKYTVFGASHKNLDLLDEKATENFIIKNGINFIIHCANIGGSRKTGYDKNSVDVVSKNLRMFFNLTRCLTPDMRMIHFGSGAEYDKNRSLVKISEDEFDKLVPKDDYGYSKYLISKYIEKTENITCLRIFGLYGKYEDYTYKFISNAIVKNLFKIPIIINQNVYFDYLYIDNFVSIVEKIIQKKPSNNILNITPTDKTDLVSIANIINEISDYKSEIIVNNDGLNKEYSGDNKRLLNEIGNLK